MSQIEVAKQQVAQVYQKFKLGEAGRIIQLQALSLTWSRVAIHLEDHPESEDFTASKTWLLSNQALDILLDESPIQAFRFGLKLVGLEAEKDSNNYYRWLQGNGLTLLADDRVQNQIVNYLDHSDGRVVAKKVHGFMSLDVSSLNQERAFSTPEFFSMVMALKLGINLPDRLSGSVCENLRQTAGVRLQDLEVRRTIRFYEQLPDTKDLYLNLKPYLWAD